MPLSDTKNLLFYTLCSLIIAACGTEAPMPENEAQSELASTEKDSQLYSLPAYIELLPGESKNIRVIRETYSSGFGSSCRTDSEELDLEWEFSEDLEVVFHEGSAEFSFKGEGRYEVNVTDRDTGLRTTTVIRFTEEPRSSFPTFNRPCY